jgi:hypothetical protein
MEVEFQENKILKSPNIDARVGSFGVDTTPFNFIDCRETFARRWNTKTEGFYFKHKKGEGVKVAAFILKTERILRNRTFSKFAKTNRDTILWIEPSHFWRSDRLKRSLFTILLRAGIKYDPEKDNYEKAMFSHEYVEPTKNAVMRFLYGYTKNVGEKPNTNGGLETKGWYGLFRGKDEEHVKSVLVWPKTRKYVPPPKLKKDLWA